MRWIHTITAGAALSVTACSLNTRSPDSDLGGWMVGESQTYGVHHFWTGQSAQFALQRVAKRKADLVRANELRDTIRAINVDEQSDSVGFGRAP